MRIYFHGGLAILSNYLDLDPLVLGRRLSPGLLLSDFVSIIRYVIMQNFTLLKEI